MRVLVLNTDGFGGRHGIALYNRDLLTALCEYPKCQEVVSIPFLMPSTPGSLPKKLTLIFDSLGSKYKYIKAAVRVVRKNPEFNIIICSHISLLTIAFLLKIWVKSPIVLAIYGIEAWKPTKRKLNNYLASKIDCFYSISQFTTQRFLSWAGVEPNKGYLLPNAIHQELYDQKEKNIELIKRYNLENRFVIMTLGRISILEKYLKGYEELILHLSKIAVVVPNITYLIAGDGDGTNRLKNIAESNGVADRVVFTGYIEEKEKADHLRLADVYVAASKGEGFGFALLEAMACGVPVIASKLDGTQEAIQHGKLGALFDPGNADELKKAILSSFNKPRVIPEGLEYFSFNNFKIRLYKIITQNF